MRFSFPSKQQPYRTYCQCHNERKDIFCPARILRVDAVRIIGRVLASIQINCRVKLVTNGYIRLLTHCEYSRDIEAFKMCAAFSIDALLYHIVLTIIDCIGVTFVVQTSLNHLSVSISIFSVPFTHSLTTGTHLKRLFRSVQKQKHPKIIFLVKSILSFSQLMCPEK